MNEQDDWVMRFIAPICDTIIVLEEVGQPGNEKPYLGLNRDRQIEEMLS